MTFASESFRFRYSSKRSTNIAKVLKERKKIKHEIKKKNTWEAPKEMINMQFDRWNYVLYVI